REKKDMPPPQITIIGSLNTDLTTRTPRLPHPGETLPATSFTTNPGGKGANQAVACARLSHPRSHHGPAATAKVEMVGCIGDDVFGGFLLDALVGSGVGVSRVRKVKGVGTGVAVVVVEEGSGENRILVTAGANAVVGDEEEDVVGAVGAGLEMVVVQLEIPVETVVRVVREAGESGVAVLLNPAPAPKGGVLPGEVFVGLEHLVMNEGEAVVLGGGVGVAEEEQGGLDGDTLRVLCEKFHEKGVVNVIITLGARGVYYSTLGGREGGERNHVPAVKVAKVVDTTAAGDTFVGAYAVAVVNGVGIGRAVEWANQAAARTVEKEGAQGAIPWLDEVDALPT
ncbi:MAG: hypothetical protein Q9182_005862, partial [Xanthomendoza sp. 2 TL-2023]